MLLRLTALAPCCFSSRVVSDHCYPFVGREQDEAGPAPRCMMHSRAMGRGKRQATARCPSSHAHANDIYQVTPAYRLGSSVSLCLVEGAEAGELGGWPEARASALMATLLPTPNPPGGGDHEGADGEWPCPR